jgi:hypothetical protein
MNNSCYASFCAFHFALKAKIDWAASKAAWIELGEMKLTDGA